MPVRRLCRWSDYADAVSSLTRTQLDALVEEASVDCYNEDEQLTGLDLPLPDPPPDGSQWIEAYRHWGG